MNIILCILYMSAGSVVLTLLLMAVLFSLLYMLYLNLDKSTRNQVNNGFRRGKHFSDKTALQFSQMAEKGILTAKHSIIRADRKMKSSRNNKSKLERIVNTFDQTAGQMSEQIFQSAKHKGQKLRQSVKHRDQKIRQRARREGERVMDSLSKWFNPNG